MFLQTQMHAYDNCELVFTASFIAENEKQIKMKVNKKQL
jgi:hypothetical protein